MQLVLEVQHRVSASVVFRNQPDTRCQFGLVCLPRHGGIPVYHSLFALKKFQVTRVITFLQDEAIAPLFSVGVK